MCSAVIARDCRVHYTREREENYTSQHPLLGNIKVARLRQVGHPGHPHTRMHTCTLAYLCTHTNTPTHNTRAHSHTCAHTYIPAHTQTHLRTIPVHTRIPAHTRTYTEDGIFVCTQFTGRSHFTHNSDVVASDPYSDYWYCCARGFKYVATLCLHVILLEIILNLSNILKYNCYGWPMVFNMCTVPEY